MLKLNLLIICLEAYFLLYQSKNANFKKTFCFFACLQAILLSGLRHIDVGADTFNYVGMFERVKGYSWEYLWDHLIHILEYEDDVEPGFYISMKLFQIFSKNARIYLIVFAAFVNIPLFVWFYKKSSNVFVSTLIYFSLFFAFVSTTGLRQTMVFVILCFIGTKFIEERRLIPFVLLTLLCFTFHRSSIAMLPMYFIAYKRPTKTYFLICSILLCLLFIFRSQYTSLLAAIGGYENYTAQYEGAGTWTFSFVMIAILIVTIWKHKTILTVNKNSVLYINGCLLACILLPVTYIDPTTLRVVFYYAIYTMFLVPDIILSFEDKEQKLVHLIIVGLLLFLYLRGFHPYSFFWDNGFYGRGPSI